MKKQELKNWNFDNGNFKVDEGIEVKFNQDDWNFTIVMPNECLTCETIEEVCEELGIED